jgi:uncharacterized membrane protein YphA (DoxX/SURF4 family)
MYCIRKEYHNAYESYAVLVPRILICYMFIFKGSIKKKGGWGWGGTNATNASQARTENRKSAYYTSLSNFIVAMDRI